MLRPSYFLVFVLSAISLAGQTPARKPSPTAGYIPSADILAKPVAEWPLESFDSFTRIEVGKTAKPWLNILGNGLYGGHLILLLGNRGDGQEFRADTSLSAITHTDLHWTGLGPVTTATHGIGYSTLSFGHNTRAVRLTYFLAPDSDDAEIWLLENDQGTDVALQFGEKAIKLERSVALQITGNRIDEIPIAGAREKQAACQRKWQQYLGGALQRMGVRNLSQPLLLREFLWDVYQVVAMVSVDRFPSSDGSKLALRNANMGGTYTVLGLDVHGRDTLQMVPAISRFDPALAREILLNMARYTDKTGRVCHRRFLSGQPIDRGHSDESYWFVTALVDYLANTHDLSIVEERAPYLENELLSEYVLFKDQSWTHQFDTRSIPAARFTVEQTSVLEHARRAVQNVSLGPHGLPLMEDGDWNDALNGMARGESLMNAGLYAYCLQQLERLWRQLGQAKVDALLGAGSYQRDLQDFSKRYEATKAAVNKYAWDGQWYVRAFDNEGNPIGSHNNKEGKLYLNAQSWVILAGIPDAQRTQSAVRSVNQYLRKDNKLSLLTPVYSKPDASVGNITRLPRGSNENGGQWRQCTLWWIAALRKTGDESDARVLFNQLLLANADLAKMQTEAYLYNEYLRGPEAADPGSAGQQAHVQQAALVLATLAELYPNVTVTGMYKNRYDFPTATEEAELYSFTGTGEKVPWKASWVVNPSEYKLSLLKPASGTAH